ncbi:hypothetical protein KFK09_007214 [Dendrobium nobile]|uniref:Uncharacterized protein n=1 Tax=Dendrobium nobile TaxID=94219 RepID=A0A8T3BWH1_DENNO|nr:hypothetical protein KFK09_007214 [Dendrobium nobile]
MTEEYLGREPTPLELHTRTHQHQADHQWVDEKLRRLIRMILYELEKVGSPLSRDHLQDRLIFLSIIHGQMLLVEDRGGGYMTWVHRAMLMRVIHPPLHFMIQVELKNL